jgi:hypothetical protein
VATAQSEETIDQYSIPPVMMIIIVIIVIAIIIVTFSMVGAAAIIGIAILVDDRRELRLKHSCGRGSRGMLAVTN